MASALEQLAHPLVLPPTRLPVTISGTATGASCSSCFGAGPGTFDRAGQQVTPQDGRGMWGLGRPAPLCHDLPCQGWQGWQRLQEGFVTRADADVIIPGLLVVQEPGHCSQVIMIARGLIKLEEGVVAGEGDGCLAGVGGRLGDL